MDAIIKTCAGLDIHLNTIVACVLSGELDRTPKKEIKEFSTTTKSLLELLDYLTEKGCTHVAMESTGVYWKPVWNILESGGFNIIIANAHNIKNLPGRKTDIKDAEWIAKLLRCGLIDKSFIPSTEIRDLRYLTRYRRRLCGDLNKEMNHIHKTLQDANIKLSSVLSDIFCVTGTKVLLRIMNNEPLDWAFVNSIYTGAIGASLKAKPDEFYEAINGRIRTFHRKMLKVHYDHILFIQSQIEEIESQIEEALEEHQESLEILTSIPGIDVKSASVIIAEIGTDMTQFPSASSISSWAGVSPGNNESAGKKKSSKIVKGNKWLLCVLCQCAWAASMKKGSYCNKKYWNMVSRMGKQKAIVAIAHYQLRLCYTLLKNKKKYEERNYDYLKKKETQRTQRLIKELQKSGYNIQKIV